MKGIFAVMLIGLVGCSYGFREDVDQIGSIRRTHTLGWKEGPREEAYRPYRQQVYQAPAQGLVDCDGMVPASPTNPSPFYAK